MRTCCKSRSLCPHWKGWQVLQPRPQLFPPAEGRESSIVVLGEKGKAQLQRDQRSHIRTTITELGKFKMTFAQVRSDSALSATYVATGGNAGLSACLSDHASVTARKTIRFCRHPVFPKS